MSSGMPEAASSRESSSDIGATMSSSTTTTAASTTTTTSTTIEERMSYVVQAGETMNAIAAKFDLTPSELARLNRIPTNSMVFPGRKLSIPVKRRKSSNGQPLTDSNTVASSATGNAVLGAASSDVSAVTDSTSSYDRQQQQQQRRQRQADDDGQRVYDKSASENDSKFASSAGDAHRVPINYEEQSDILSGLMIPPRAGGMSSQQLDNSSSSSVMPTRARLPHVLKINARHITDGQGVVTGTLLITPNNIMFSPNVSDLIVIEHGTEHYEVTAPIDMIAGAALYSDIAIMRTKMHQKPIVCNIPVQVYYSEEHRPKTPPSSPNRLSAEPKTGSKTTTSTTESESGSEPVSPRPTRTPPSSPVVGGRKDKAADEHATPQRGGSRDMEEPEVFAALERLLPKPAQPQENSMLYLCLRMGKPRNKVVKVPAVALGRRKLKCEYWFGIPRNRVDEVYKFFQRNYPDKYGDVIELNMEERGFEDIDSDDDDDGDGNDNNDGNDDGDNRHNKHRIDNGNDDNKDDNHGIHDSGAENNHRRGGNRKLHERGSSSSTDDLKTAPDTPKSATDGALTGVLNRVGSFKNPFKLPRFFEGPNTPHPSFSSCEWEVIALKDESNNAPATSSSNLLNPLTPDEILLPEMVDDSEILDEEHRKMLYKVIPARAEGYAWRLVYSTTRNGFSLKTFYREMSRHDGPVLLAITDTEEALFGVFASTAIHPSDHFYGTGEMFLWTFHPSFTKYSWSGDNQYFIKGNQDSLVFGSGDGEFGLYLDGDLYHGRSSPCKTFNNEVLSQTNDFVIKSLEAWGFF